MNDLMSKIASFSIIRTAAVGLVISVAYFFSLYDSGEAIVNQMAGVKTQIEEEIRKKTETEKVLKKEEQMRSDVALLAKTYEEVKSKIPIDFDASELRVIVEQTSSAANVKINRLKNIQPAPSQNPTPEEKLVQQVGIEYSFQGDYGQMQSFISQLAQLEKVIKVSDLKITAPEGTTGPSKQLNFEAVILGYKQTPNAEAVDPNKAAKDLK